MDDIKKRLDEVLDMERGTIDRRLDDALGPQDGAPQQGGAGRISPQGAGRAAAASRARRQQQGQQSSSPRGQQSGAERRVGRAGRRAAAGQSAARGDNDQFAEMLKNIAEPQEELPLATCREDVPGAVKELQNYEFMDPEAQHKFTELMEMLKKAMTETFFKDMYDQIANMSPEDMARMKQMVQRPEPDAQRPHGRRRAGLREVHGASTATSSAPTRRSRWTS